LFEVSAQDLVERGQRRLLPGQEILLEDGKAKNVCGIIGGRDGNKRR
jgi:hypothetical protein